MTLCEEKQLKTEEEIKVLETESHILYKNFCFKKEIINGYEYVILLALDKKNNRKSYVVIKNGFGVVYEGFQSPEGCYNQIETLKIISNKKNEKQNTKRKRS